jgi:hypothetical protein
MKLLRSFAIVALSTATPVPAAAATLTVGSATMQNILVERMFNKDGRFYLQDGICYAYLESPRIWLGQARVFIEAQLRSQLGVEISGQCVGSGLAPKVVMSGRLVGAGTTLTFVEVRIDRVDDDAAGASDLLQSIAPALPPIDILSTIRARLADAHGIPISVDSLRIDSVTTSDDAVTVRFDIGLRAP